MLGHAGFCGPQSGVVARCAGVQDAAEHHVRRQRRLELECLLPEPVVFGFGFVAAVRVVDELHRPEAQSLHALELRDRVIDPGKRHEGVADEPIGRNRAVLEEPIVVRVNHREVHRAIGDLLEESARKNRGEQKLSVDPILVLLVQALQPVAGAVCTRAVRIEIALPGELHLPAPTQVLARVGERHPLHQPGVSTAVRQCDQTRGAIPVLLGQECDEVRRRLEVTIARDDLVLATHSTPPSPARRVST